MDVDLVAFDCIRVAFGSSFQTSALHGLRSLPLPIIVDDLTDLKPGSCLAEAVSLQARESKLQDF